MSFSLYQTLPNPLSPSLSGIRNSLTLSLRTCVAGKKLRELTVHHKDHNHDNNPPDGSNWELLCVYCHDHEHEKYLLKGLVDGSAPVSGPEPSAIGNPFANLDSLLKTKSGDASPPEKEGTEGQPKPAKPNAE